MLLCYNSINIKQFTGIGFMNQETSYESNEILIDEQAIQGSDYIVHQAQKANHAIKKATCLKLDILAKDMIDLFQDLSQKEPLWAITNPILVHFIFKQTDFGIHHINYLTHQNEIITNELCNRYNIKRQVIEDLDFSLFQHCQQLSSLIRDFIPNPDHFIMVQQGNQGLDEEKAKDKIPFFRVHKETIDQDIQQVINVFIETIDPNYLRAKENYTLKQQVNRNSKNQFQNSPYNSLL